MPAADQEQLKADQRDIDWQLRTLVGEDPASTAVQEQIARHYTMMRGFCDETGLKNTTNC